MAGTLTHRGPDDAGCFADAAAGIALGFRRLSILDLSDQGHQPMTSHCGRFVIAYNGEIYNHPELRRELENVAGRTFRGQSDTEILLEACAEYGVPETLRRLDGMFAFALWDKEKRTLWLARDRFGEKPLYYTRADGRTIFASELKALRQCPAWTPELDREALALFLRYAYVPSPRSVYVGVFKLPAGHYLRIGGDGVTEELTAYWNAVQRTKECLRNPLRMDAIEAGEQLQSLIDASVHRRIIADVPLGAFLSGGYDSSTVVAAMARGGAKVRTYCVGFDDPKLDESAYASAVAEHLGTEHTTLRVGTKECLQTIDRLPQIYDEPFADASQIPTAVLCRLTRDHVTVSLSGDGGDELFGGYPRYRIAAAQWGRLAAARPWRRRAATAALKLVAGRSGRLGRKIRRLAQRQTHVGREDLFRDMVSHWTIPEGLDEIGGGASSALSTTDTAPIGDDSLAFMVFDAATYLVDDLQVKMDRASMAASLEVRAPLLDHNIAEFAWRLPPSLTVAPPGKRILRQLLHRRVPAALVERTKQGFEPPVGDWLRGPLREKAEHYLSKASLARHGLLDPRSVASLWREHLGGRKRSFALWNVYILGAWLEAWA